MTSRREKAQAIPIARASSTDYSSNNRGLAPANDFSTTRSLIA